MSLDAAVREAARGAGFGAEIRSITRLGGGCIHRVVRIDFADGASLAAKVNEASRIGLFQEEEAGLRSLAATQAVTVPQPLAAATASDLAVLLLEWLEPGTVDSGAWSVFGEELARLHRHDAGSQYGFDTDNHLGTTPQPNQWCDDWVKFNAEHRLGHQVALASRAGTLSADETRRVEHVIDRLETLIPSRPHPALLHGDLWSGNALPCRDDRGSRIAVIDPACSVGDGWADVAMMKLFGGFPERCFDAYASCVDDSSQVEDRVRVYQLYHVLNHVNIFGRGYVGQAMTLCDALY